MKCDILILGGGPAGLSAALYAKRAGLVPVVLERSIYGGQVTNTPEVENYPGILNITGVDLAMALYNQVTNLGVEIRLEEPVSYRLDTDPKVVATPHETYEARAVIIANGAKRRTLGCPGEEVLSGKGVSYCATCDGAFFKGKDVAVMGGGNTAVEDALYLAGICRSVTLIFRRDRLTAQRKLVEAAEGKENLRLCPRSLVTAVTGGDLVEAVEITGAENGEKRSLPVSALFVAIGLEPDNAPFAPPLALDDYGYILAGEDCKTNVPGVFAAGDSRTKLLRQIVTAVADGAVAAMQAERFLHG